MTTTTTSTHRLRTLALGVAATAGALLGLAVPGTSPAGASPPTAIQIVGALGYDQPGPSGEHVISWNAPEHDGGKAPIEYQIERWDATLTDHLGTYTQSAAIDPHRTVPGMPDDVPYRYRVRARNADGWGGWGGFAAARVFVGQTHLRPFASPFDLVDRQAADFGVSLSVGQRATWANTLTSRQKVTELIDHLASHPQRANREKIIRLYFAYFDRAAEPSGLDYWQGRLDSGTAGLGQVSSFFAGSQEFKSTYGGTTNAQFVELVYQNVLFRSPDASGLAYWKGRLDNGTITRGHLMLQFSESAEGRALRAADVIVADAYVTMVRKQPTNGLVAAYAPHVEAGASAGDVAMLLLPLNDYPHA